MGSARKIICGALKVPIDREATLKLLGQTFFMGRSRDFPRQAAVCAGNLKAAIRELTFAAAASNS